MLKSVDIEKLTEEASELQSRQENEAPRRRLGVRLVVGVVQAAVAAGIILGAVMTSRYLIATKPDVPTRPRREAVYTVNIQEVVLRAHRPMLTHYGQVVAARAVDLRSLVSGEIVSVNPKLRAGGLVDAGEVLVEIDKFNYEGAVAESEANVGEIKAKIAESDARIKMEADGVEHLKEQLSLAKRDLERAQRLVKRRTGTEKQVDDRRLIVSQRMQNLEQRENTLIVERAKSEQQRAVLKRLDWRLQQSRRNLENTQLKAPFDAVVRSESAEPGRLVNANDVVATLYDRNALDARFTLTDAQYGRLLNESALNGREVEVRWYLGDTPIVYKGRIDRVGAEVASARGGVDMYARIEPTSASVPIRPGAFVEVHLADRTYDNTVTIPETALYNGTHVFLDVDGRLQRRDITVEAFDDGAIIVSGDFEAGDRIVTTRIAEAGDGLRVREVGAPPSRGKAPRAGQQPQGAGKGERGGRGQGRPQAGRNGQQKGAPASAEQGAAEGQRPVGGKGGGQGTGPAAGIRQ